jgi:hypothetical protein
VQEFDVRVWITTWAEPALAQIVQLEQYFESDPIVLGLCGQRAQLFEKHGIDRITDDLLDQQVTVRVSVGLGAGDPQQRLSKFQAAASVVAPLAQSAPEFQSGQYEINILEIWNEVFGAVGYKDGGERFIKQNQGPRPNPMGDLQTQKLMAEIQQRERQGKGAILTGLANVAKVALGKKQLESDVVDMLLGHQRDAKDLGFQHGHLHNQSMLAATEHGHTHGMAIAEHRRNLANDAAAQQQAQQEQQQQEGEGAEQGGAAPSPSSPPGAPPPESSTQEPAPSPLGDVEFVRHPQTQRIIGARLKPTQQAQASKPQKSQPAKSSEPDRLSRLEQQIKELHAKHGKPRKAKLVRDKDGMVTGLEEVQ